MFLEKYGSAILAFQFSFIFILLHSGCNALMFS